MWPVDLLCYFADVFRSAIWLWFLGNVFKRTLPYKYLIDDLILTTVNTSKYMYKEFMFKELVESKGLY